LSPHEVALVPTSQTVPLQHPAHAPQGDWLTQSPFASQVSPLGQLHGATTWHAPPPSGMEEHVACVLACVQSLHVAPPPPQAWSAVPATHAPFAQHPLQLDAPHAPESTSMIVVVPAKSDERPHAVPTSATSTISMARVARRRPGDARRFITQLEA
jgi:hypothetical protein